MLAQALTCVCALAGAFIAIVASSPLVLPAVLLAALAFGRIVRTYRPTAAEVEAWTSRTCLFG